MSMSSPSPGRTTASRATWNTRRFSTSRAQRPGTSTTPPRSRRFLPNYLRFIRGLVDTNGLPLNVSRELLQESRVAAKLKKALTKRSLDMIEKLAEDKEKYRTFWTAFGRVLKEVVVEDPANRERILK